MKVSCFFIFIPLFFFSCKKENEPHLISFTDIPESFSEKLHFNEFTFDVSVKGTGTLKKIMIIIHSPSLNDTLIRIINGKVYGVKTGDLNNNNLPEIYAFVIGKGVNAKGSFEGFEFGEDEIVQIEFPEPDPRIMSGYMGQDTLFIRGKHLVREFPVYNEDDFSFNPSQITRVIEYSLDDSHPYGDVRLLNLENSYVK